MQMENLYTLPILYSVPCVWGLVTNSSNHWILCQPDQVRKTETMAKVKLIGALSSMR